MPQYGALRIHSQGGIQVTEARDLLAQIDDAYNAIYAYDTFLDSADASRRRRLPIEFIELGLFARPWGFGIEQIRDWPPKPEALQTLVPSRDRLILKSTKLESPGFWEVLGSLNPLEVIRKYIGDAHERRKDREYREASERRRLELENRLLHTEVLNKEADFLKRLGATEQDFAALRNALLYDPLRKLELLQDRGIIDGSDDIEPTKR